MSWIIKQDHALFSSSSSISYFFFVFGVYNCAFFLLFTLPLLGCCVSFFPCILLLFLGWLALVDLFIHLHKRPYFFFFSLHCSDGAQLRWAVLLPFFFKRPAVSLTVFFWFLLLFIEYHHFSNLHASLFSYPCSASSSSSFLLLIPCRVKRKEKKK